MMTTANMSGYAASIPGAFIGMYSLQNCSMRFPTNSSKVALHARATLEVPEMERGLLLVTFSYFVFQLHVNTNCSLHFNKKERADRKGFGFGLGNALLLCLPMI